MGRNYVEELDKYSLGGKAILKFVKFFPELYHEDNNYFPNKFKTFLLENFSNLPDRTIFLGFNYE
jgi:hypothetical protein